MTSLFDFDIFISYAHLDNQTLDDPNEGWVTMLHRALEIRLGQLVGESVRIWRDPKLYGNDYFDEQIADHIARSAALICVLSPRYIKSEWCITELGRFCQNAQQRDKACLYGYGRVFKVGKTPVSVAEQPPEIQSLLGYDFYRIDPETGRPREFSQGFGHHIDPEFWERLEDLAYDISQMLRAIRGQIPIASEDKSLPSETVFLAETTSDLAPERDQIRREILAHHRRVLPDYHLPLFGPQLERAVTQDLSHCSLAVHLIGRNYGLVPEESQKSIVEMQHHLSVQRSHETIGFSRLVWIPADIEIDDPRQRVFVEALREDPPLQPGDDLVQATLEEFKSILRDRLVRSSQHQLEQVLAKTLGPTRVYLLCDQQDVDAVRPLDDYLYDRGFEVILPLFEGSEDEITELHRETLRSCDAVLIYYGMAREAWLRGKLRDLRKAFGYHPTTPIKTTAVYIAPPVTPQKERFRTREVDAVIIQAGDFQPNDLSVFLEKFREEPGRES